jgi:hypothetical protein
LFQVVDGIFQPTTEGFDEEPWKNEKHAVGADRRAGENDCEFSIVYTDLVTPYGYEDADEDEKYLGEEQLIVRAGAFG